MLQFGKCTVSMVKTNQYGGTHEKLAILFLCLLVCLLASTTSRSVAEDYLVSDAASAKGVGSAQTAGSEVGIALPANGSAALTKAIGQINAGSYLDAINSLAKLGGDLDADRYAAYAQAQLSLLREDPAAAMETLENMGDFLDGAYQLALVKSLRLHRYAQDGRFGYVDTTGAWVIAPQFDWAERVFRRESAPWHNPNTSAYQPEELYTVASVFIGETEVTPTDTAPLQGKYGLVRNDGTLIVPARYSEILWTVNGVAAVSDDTGVSLFNTVTGQAIGETYQAVGAYQNGFISVQKGKLWGYLNPTTGALIGDGFVWESALPFSENKAGVSQKGLYGYIDTTGSVVIALQFSQVAPFSEGLAGVRTQKRWGLINDKGTVVLKPTYAGIKTFQNGLCAVQKGSVWGLINPSGEVILRIKYSEIGDFDPIFHRAWIRLNKLWGLVAATGDIVLKPSWGKHDEFSGNTLCRVAYQNRYGYIDSNGKIRIVNTYSNAAPFRADYGGVTVSKGQQRYLNKSQRGFTLTASVPVECLCGFIEGRAITETERVIATPAPIAGSPDNTPAPTDADHVTLVEVDRTIAYTLYDAKGDPIPVPVYAATQG